MENVKFENGKLVVPTPKGDIIVTVKTDDLYPGVYVDFVSDDIKESVILSEEDGKPSLQLAMVEYNAVDKELSSYVWGKTGQEDYSYKAVHNDSLIFNEDFEILPVGTKVLHNGKLGYIMGDDKDNCPEGYHSSLNYYIKDAINGESYGDVQKRISSENSPWYDFMDLWDSVEVIPNLNLENFKMELDKNDFFNDFLDKAYGRYDIEVLKSWSIDRWNEEVMLELCFSYSSFLSRLVYDNEEYFKEYACKLNTDLERYIDYLIMLDGKVVPFTSNNPYEFFKLITEFSKKISIEVNK